MTVDAFLRGLESGLAKQSALKPVKPTRASRAIISILKRLMRGSSQQGVTPSSVASELKSQERKKKRKKRKGA
jgi:hypothetical protein